VKKVEFHFFPSNTEKPRSFRISLFRLIWWAIGVIVAMLGFLLFSPIQIFDTISTTQIFSLYKENKRIERNIGSIQSNLENLKNQLKEAKILRDTSIELSGLSSIDSIATNSDTVKQPISKVFAQYKSFLLKLEEDSSYAKSLPTRLPLNIKPVVTNRFGLILDPFTEKEMPHRGIDFAASEGDTVYATGDGRLIESQNHRGYGLVIKIEHSPDIRSFYAHLSEVLVKKGASVQRGEPIGIVGKSGRTTGPNLHYEIRLQGVPINPEPLLIGI